MGTKKGCYKNTSHIVKHKKNTIKNKTGKNRKTIGCKNYTQNFRPKI